ncbi:zincin-like metallopeptidase domain-containing protein, partial [Rhizorhapis sp. SPR117]|uniref:zincin-like metallopeptidase domain-containing protein n=1 Tax=Rhizorhapis sp. SPR117 TaxID=2912611 RepID=UPI001F4447ED|nr:hypothetical protein [Rhizorhapis sp. SPR117]
VLEAPMDFTFQPPFLAGLSGYVAELTASFVCAALGITPTVRHADYIGSWLEIIRGDDRAILRAAGAASKAADYLLAFRPEAAIAANDDDPDPDPDGSMALEGRIAA